MANYTYPTNQVRFGIRDTYPVSNSDKRISGSQLDLEFDQLTIVSALKLNALNPSFTGVMTGGGVVDGGTF